MDGLYEERTPNVKPSDINAEAGGIRAVERAVDLLDCFANRRGALSVTELQRHLGLSRPTLYRLLRTLESKGLVRSFGAPLRYELGARVVELAGGWIAGRDVVSIAQAPITELWRTTGETVALFVPTSPATKLCVQELASRQALVYTRGAGFSEPMTVGSSGKVMLAHMPIRDIEPVLAAMEDEDERTALAIELSRIQAQGYCLSVGSIIAGAISIAAPVFESDGGVAASICLFGAEARLDETARRACVDRVVEAAGSVSAALGYRPGIAAE